MLRDLVYGEKFPPRGKGKERVKCVRCRNPAEHIKDEVGEGAMVVCDTHTGESVCKTVGMRYAPFRKL